MANNLNLLHRVIPTKEERKKIKVMPFLLYEIPKGTLLWDNRLNQNVGGQWSLLQLQMAGFTISRKRIVNFTAIENYRSWCFWYKKMIAFSHIHFWSYRWGKIIFRMPNGYCRKTEDNFIIVEAIKENSFF